MIPVQSWSEYLKRDLSEKRKSNPRYSLRSYAKALAISPAHLSQIISGKRKVKAASAFRLAASLGLTSNETMTWLKNETMTNVEVKQRRNILSEGEFHLISEWYYFGILGLASLKTNLAEPSWIAKKLGLPIPIAKRALQDLVKFKLVEIRGVQFRQISDPIRTQSDAPSALFRRYHKQNLELAMHKIDSVDVSHREFSSMTINISPKRISAAKELIRKFNEEFTEEVSGGSTSEVYNLNIQFFPLTQS